MLVKEMITPTRVHHYSDAGMMIRQNVDFSEQSKAKTALIGIGVSAVAAGLAAVMNINTTDKESDINADD